MDFVYEILLKTVGSDIVDNIANEFKDYFLNRSQPEKVLLYFKLQHTCSNKELSEVFGEEFKVNIMTSRLTSQGYIKNIDKENNTLIFEVTPDGINLINKKFFISCRESKTENAKKQFIKVCLWFIANYPLKPVFTRLLSPNTPTFIPAYFFYHETTNTALAAGLHALVCGPGYRNI